MSPLCRIFCCSCSGNKRKSNHVTWISTGVDSHLLLIQAKVHDTISLKNEKFSFTAFIVCTGFFTLAPKKFDRICSCNFFVRKLKICFQTSGPWSQSVPKVRYPLNHTDASTTSTHEIYSPKNYNYSRWVQYTSEVYTHVCPY